VGRTYHDFAADVAGVIEQLAGDRPVHLLGHAFGNRIARTPANDRPELVRSVILRIAAEVLAFLTAVGEASP
jgi:pimeloyl-ACP methyl ester carboxylesterase